MCDKVFPFVFQVEHADLLFEVFMERVFKSEGNGFAFVVVAAFFALGFIGGRVVFDKIDEVIVEFHIVVADTDGVIV